VLVGDHLGETADHLVGHFVDRARRAGASWTDIGRSMGVTKQAVQKRFVPKEPAQDFTRFTPRARNVVVAAQNEARAARNVEIRPEHLILGLLAEPQGLAMLALADLGVGAEALRLGHDYVGTEHILLALLELEGGTGVLSGLGVEKAAVEAAVTQYLSSWPGGGAPPAGD